MSMRTDYQRPAEFGASRASTKAGKRYEEKVGGVLSVMRPLGYTLKAQAYRNGGYVDYELASLKHVLLIEVKAQWSLAAFLQLAHYAGEDILSLSRVCICKVFHPHVPLPEPATCLRLDQLLLAKPGSLTIIPWSGR